MTLQLTDRKHNVAQTALCVLRKRKPDKDGDADATARHRHGYTELARGIIVAFHERNIAPANIIHRR